MPGVRQPLLEERQSLPTLREPSRRAHPATAPEVHPHEKRVAESMALGSRMNTKQTVITKHPEGQGSYCLRLKFTGGGTLEVVSVPLPFADLIEALDEQLALLRRIEGMAVEGASER